MKKRECFPNTFSSSKILLHQPKRLQSKFEDAYHVVEAAGQELKSYIQENM